MNYLRNYIEECKKIRIERIYMELELLQKAMDEENDLLVSKVYF